MQKKITQHTYRISGVFILSLTAWIVGLIIIFISFLLIFFKNWPNISIIACPNTTTFLYLKRITIIQIIYTATICLFTLCLIIISMIAFVHRLNIRQHWTSNLKYRVFYPFFIGFGFVMGLVSLLYVINIYSVLQVSAGLSCLTSDQITKLNNKLNPLVIVLALICLMIVLNFLIFFVLPYKYFTLSQDMQKYQSLQQPIKQIKKQKVIQNTKQKKIRNSNLQISRQQLLSVAATEKKSQQIGVGEQQPYVEMRQIQKNQIGVGNDYTQQKIPSIEKIDIGVGSLEIYNNNNQKIADVDKQLNVGKLMPVLTPIEQKQYEDKIHMSNRLSSASKIEKRNAHPTAPKIQKRFLPYIQTQSGKKQIDKYQQVYQEHPKNSANRLLQTPLKVTKGPQSIDWGHYNLLLVDERLNSIYNQEEIEKPSKLPNLKNFK